MKYSFVIVNSNGDEIGESEELFDTQEEIEEAFLEWIDGYCVGNRLLEEMGRDYSPYDDNFDYYIIEVDEDDEN